MIKAPTRKKQVRRSVEAKPAPIVDVRKRVVREKIREMVERGVTVEDIAHTLKMKIEVVAAVVGTIYSKSELDPLTDVSTSIRVEIARLDRAMNAIWDEVLRGNVDSIRVMVLLMDRRAKFMGVDGGVDSVPVAEVQRLMAAYAQGYKIVISELFKSGALVGVDPEEAQQRMRDHVVRLARNDDRPVLSPRRAESG